jgi:hypothetical protein
MSSENWQTRHAGGIRARSVQHTPESADCQMPLHRPEPMHSGVDQRVQYVSAGRPNFGEEGAQLLTLVGEGSHSWNGGQTKIGDRSCAAQPKIIVNIYLL